MRRAALWLIIIVLAVLPVPFWAGAQEGKPSHGPIPQDGPKAGGGPVWIIRLADTVNPGSADFLRKGLAQAQAAGASCVIIQLDTPGGLVDSMRAMVKDIIACEAPVVVYVSPSGARAASAGAFIVLAGGVAAMAPATNVGAAHPVAGGGKEIKGAMAEKVMADLKAMIRSLAKKKGRDPALAEKMVTESMSLDAGQALKRGFIDLIARDLGELLTQLEGRVVETGAGKKKIATKGKALHFHDPDLRHSLLSILANPNVAYILLMIGAMGLYFELSNPGAIFPGVVGGIALILALFAMSALPVSYTGLALIGLALVLFIAEIKIVSHGMLSVAGGVCLILGSIMLFESGEEVVRVSLSVLIPVVVAVTGFFAAVTFLAMRAQMRKKKTGSEGLVGEMAQAVDQARVRIMGELWNAEAPYPLKPGERVRVAKVEGLKLWVEPLPLQTKDKGGPQ